MLVSCSACSAKFQLPDEKIAGRKARMKCKKCGAPIVIDGTSVQVSAGSKAPPPPSRLASKPKHEAPSFADLTVALSAGDAEALTRQSREAETAAAPETDDRITPISNPLASEHLLDQSYVDAAMDALEQKVFSLPAPRPAPPSAAAPPKPKPPTPEGDDEATQMMDLPRFLSGTPATAGPSAEGDSDEPTRMLDLQGSGLASGAGAPGAQPGRRAEGEGDEATRIFDADPVSRGPRLPPRPSLPRPPSAATPSSAPHTASAHVSAAPSDVALPAMSLPAMSLPAMSLPAMSLPAMPVPGGPVPAPIGPADLPFSLSDPTPFEVPDVTLPAEAERPQRSGPSAAPAAQEIRSERAPGDLTVQRARVPSLPPEASRANWGLYLFLLALAATGSLVGVFFFARPTFDRAITQTRQTLGLGDGQPAGPAFDAAAAASELARVAALAPTCKTAGGPTGAGRARVLFQMSGTASSAAVSPPFHTSNSEACLLTLFKSARVPAFGGQPVIVTKTFRVD